MPLLSIVMPAHNLERTISTSIRSVLEQTFSDWELIVIDDCSTDNTFKIAAEFAKNDSRITALRRASNSGSPAVPRNAGIKAARGRFVAFLDADDRWLPDKAARQIEFMLSQNAALSCTGYLVEDADGNIIGSFAPPPSAGYADLLKQNSIGCLTAMYDTSKIGKHYFPICGHEDYALWLQITKKGVRVPGIESPLAVYRRAPGTISYNKTKLFKYFWNIYRNREGFPPHAAAFMCARYVVLNNRKYLHHPSD